MSKLDFDDIQALIEVAPLFKPQVQKAVEAIQLFGPEVKELLTGAVVAVADIRAAAVQRYESHGFTRDEAILLTLDSGEGMKRIIAKSK